MRLFNCETKEVAVEWPVADWPLFCPFCGRQVHPRLSAHHEMVIDGAREYTSPPQEVWLVSEDTQ